MKAYILDFVKTKTHNNVGRVYQKHALFSQTNEEDWWFDGLKPAVDPSAKNEPWYSILCNDGGSVMVPERDIAEVSTKPIGKFENTWADFYFRDMDYSEYIKVGEIGIDYNETVSKVIAVGPYSEIKKQLQEKISQQSYDCQNEQAEECGIKSDTKMYLAEVIETNLPADLEIGDIGIYPCEWDHPNYWGLEKVE